MYKLAPSCVKLCHMVTTECNGKFCQTPCAIGFVNINSRQTLQIAEKCVIDKTSAK